VSAVQAGAALSTSERVLGSVALRSSDLADCVLDCWVGAAGEHAVRFVKDPVDLLLVEVSERRDDLIVGKEQASERVDKFGERGASERVRKSLTEEIHVHHFAPRRNEVFHLLASCASRRRVSVLTLKFLVSRRKMGSTSSPSPENNIFLHQI
jgi:hypothetical protein